MTALNRPGLRKLAHAVQPGQLGSGGCLHDVSLLDSLSAQLDGRGTAISAGIASAVQRPITRPGRSAACPSGVTDEK